MRYSYMFLMLLLALGAAAQQKSADQAREEITAYMLSGKLDEARVKAEQLALSSPEGENLLLVGAMYEVQGKRTQADAWYKKAAGDPGLAKDKLWHDLSFVQLRRGDTLKTISYQRASLAVNPGQVDLQQSLATIYSAKGKADSALFYALGAQVKDPGNFELARIAVDVYWSAGEIAKATAHLEQVYTVNRGDSVQLALAYLYLQGEYFEKALPHFLALSVSRPDAEILYSLGKCHERLGSVSKAIAAVERAIALSSVPNDHFEQFLVELYSWKGDQQQMLERYVNGSRQNVKGFAGWLKGYQQTVDKANQTYAKMETAEMTDLSADFLSLARAYVGVKDYRTGLMVIEDYKLSPKASVDSVAMLSVIALMGLKQYDRAKEQLEVLMKNSTDKGYHDLMLAICYQLRDYQGVVSFFEKNGAQAFSLEKDVRDRLMFVSYSQIGDTEKAKRYWRL